MKKIKIIVSIILLSISILIITFNILSAFSIPLFGFRLYQVITGSMEPVIKVNDYIIIKEYDEYQVNDIITYIDNEGSYVTHRIIEIQDNFLITKGDANNTTDEPIDKSKIVGKVVMKIRFLKYINLLFKSYLFWISMLVIGLLVIFLLPSK